MYVMGFVCFNDICMFLVMILVPAPTLAGWLRKVRSIFLLLQRVILFINPNAVGCTL